MLYYLNIILLLLFVPVQAMYLKLCAPSKNLNYSNAIKASRFKHCRFFTDTKNKPPIIELKNGIKLPQDKVVGIFSEIIKLARSEKWTDNDTLIQLLKLKKERPLIRSLRNFFYKETDNCIRRLQALQFVDQNHNLLPDVHAVVSSAISIDADNIYQSIIRSPVKGKYIKKPILPSRNENSIIADRNEKTNLIMLIDFNKWPTTGFFDNWPVPVKGDVEDALSVKPLRLEDEKEEDDLPYIVSSDTAKLT